MFNHDHLLSFAKEAVQLALKSLENIGTAVPEYKFADDLPREVKATADLVLDGEIICRLATTGIPVLSEESGEHESMTSTSLKWVVDPLDGTVNYVRELAPCAVSIALYEGESPIFGVIGEYPTSRLAWGGPSIGAFIDDHPVRVSSISKKNKAILCTGFPSRFDFDGEGAMDFMIRMREYCKVRMLGSASLSLMQLAKGSADAYSEQDIMIWDVAAGLAIVEGAGGSINISAGRYVHSFNIFASNGLLQPD
ncbi:Inositol monophosphatase/fructose-1,6-bisphosphatase family protein [uncultured Woeseiaceae bacterium]|uniref:Inositol monophosphatase/fructose-1,6-bisphosphatase family protein n=1 Tax=uncultured Woeseiaceae bacterium TaxID=1983305 RepID=A0A7D9D119_9GAMM|nr:Inositol monophosphatase/fructose-1,6-bisphosphatase family protein [uncultured Woeseiaceae bacterium]